MKFDFTEEELMIQKAARDFARKEIAPRVADFDRSGEYDPAIVRKMAELGFLGGVLPAKYGGSEMSYTALALMLEEIGYVCLVTATHAGWPSCSLGQGLLQYGTEEQRLKYLVPLVQGIGFGGTGVTEPHSGTDIVRNMETTARRDGDSYVLNGSKMWISNLELADWFITFAQADKSRGHKGINAFIVEKDSPGLSVHPFDDLLGKRYFKTGELALEDVRVPKENLVGREYEGYKVLMAGTEIGRLSCAARCVGQTRATLDASIEYAKQRMAFGQPIGKYQLIQSKITDMMVGLEGARLMVYKLAWLKDNGVERAQREASMAKMYATDVLMRAATEAVQIHGAYGCSSEYDVSRYFRDAKLCQIMDGTNEIHRVIIAEHGLGYR